MENQCKSDVLSIVFSPLLYTCALPSLEHPGSDSELGDAAKTDATCFLRSSCTCLWIIYDYDGVEKSKKTNIKEISKKITSEESRSKERKSEERRCRCPKR